MTKQDLIAFEQRIADLYDAGELPYLVHLSGGNEGQLIGIFKQISKGDYVFSTHRNHYHYLLHGGQPDELEEMILSGKSMFVFNRRLNFYSSSIVCGTAAIAAGVAWALKRKGSKQKVWCFLGDGAEDEGHFYEAARYVDGQDLPCTFVIEDNDRSVIATKKQRWGKNATCFNKLPCVYKYRYKATWPHGGTGSGKWLEFKQTAKVERPKAEAKPILLASTHTEKYKEAVDWSMRMLAERGAIFVGYNVGCSDAYGSLAGIPDDQRLETPLAENLMTGLALGMSLEGFKAVLFFERHDFIYNALDILVNQADIIDFLSNGQYSFPIIIKAVVGSVKPFYAGITHTSNLEELFEKIFMFPTYAPKTAEEVISAYKIALDSKRPVLISERKELY